MVESVNTLETEHVVDFSSALHTLGALPTPLLPQRALRLQGKTEHRVRNEVCYFGYFCNKMYAPLHISTY